ncbi:MAG: class I SAM-dependent methyltransferase [Capnocytophaga sp.]|nr:class I SAM-dependent methyltransferase [Capnocytophaga sp.]
MLTEEQISFISSHANEDIKSVALQYRRDDMPLLLRQIAGLQTAKRKLPKWYEFPQIMYPIQLSLEQASSEITAQYKTSLLPTNRTLLVDLTGGLGVDFSFLAPHFERAIYVEQNEELCRLATNNMPILGLSNATIVQASAEQFLKTMPAADLVYIDPARRNHSGQKVFKIEDCSPNLEKILPELQTKTQQIVVKYSPMLDVSLALQNLKQVSEIHIVSVDNDCKELLFVLTNRKQPPTIHTVNFRNNNANQYFSFEWTDEPKAQAAHATTMLRYLYEPNASILKSGGFVTVGQRFGIYKLHPNTHLYTSDSLDKNFPGRIFEIKECRTHNKSNLKELTRLYPKANISIRNFPMTVAEIRKKTKIKEGGELYIFATTIANNTKIWLIGQKIN